jgi:uncharacterized membrane protein (DUF485 family)
MLDPAIDWETVACSDAFRDLVRRRRRLTLAGAGAVTMFYGAFVIVVATGAGLVGRHVGGPFTVGHVWAAAQIPFAWATALVYARAARGLDALADVVRGRASMPATDSATTADVAWRAAEVPA